MQRKPLTSPSKHLVSVVVDINSYPNLDKDHAADANTELAIGDLHANVVKLLYFLFRQQVVKFKTDPITKALRWLFQEDSEDAEIYASIFNIFKKKSFKTEKKTVKGQRVDAPVVSNNRVADNLLVAKDIDDFENFIGSIVRKNKIKNLILIGDATADRVGNDVLFLILFAQLDKVLNGKIDLLLSNHDLEFIEYYENNFQPKKTDEFGWIGLPRGQSASLQALHVMIHDEVNFPGLKTKVKKLIDDHYKKRIKALSYTLDAKNNKITIHSHAPMGLNTIRDMVDFLNDKEKFPYLSGELKYEDDTAEKLANTIDQINAAVSSIAEKGELNKLFNRQHSYKVSNAKLQVKIGEDENHNPQYKQMDYCHFNTDPSKHPFLMATWNRLCRERDFIDDEKGDVFRPLKYNNYEIGFTHGHDLDDPGLNGNITNLDNELAKGWEVDPGTEDNVRFAEGELTFFFQHPFRVVKEAVPVPPPQNPQPVVEAPVGQAPAQQAVDTRNFFQRHWKKFLIGFLAAIFVVGSVLSFGALPAIAASVAAVVGMVATVSSATAGGIGLGVIGLAAGATGIGLASRAGERTDKFIDRHWGKMLVASLVMGIGFPLVLAFAAASIVASVAAAVVSSFKIFGFVMGGKVATDVAFGALGVSASVVGATVGASVGGVVNTCLPQVEAQQPAVNPPGQEQAPQPEAAKPEPDPDFKPSTQIINEATAEPAQLASSNVSEVFTQVVTTAPLPITAEQQNISESAKHLPSQSAFSQPAQPLPSIEEVEQVIEWLRQAQPTKVQFMENLKNCLTEPGKKPTNPMLSQYKRNRDDYLKTIPVDQAQPEI